MLKRSSHSKHSLFPPFKNGFSEAEEKRLKMQKRGKKFCVHKNAIRSIIPNVRLVNEAHCLHHHCIRCKGPSSFFYVSCFFVTRPNGLNWNSCRLHFEKYLRSENYLDANFAARNYFPPINASKVFLPLQSDMHVVNVGRDLRSVFSSSTAQSSKARSSTTRSLTARKFDNTKFDNKMFDSVKLDSVKFDST
jgi:hypothetical protein